MLTAVLSLTGALVYGAADFLGGLAAKRMTAILATAIAAVAGLVVMLVALPLLGGRWATADLAWGALSGLTGAVAIMLLYACLAIGPMSILSPLTAVVSAIAPIVWALVVEGETLSWVGYAGLAVALVAVVLVGFVPGEKVVRPSARGLLYATGAGLAIGSANLTVGEVVLVIVVFTVIAAASVAVPVIAFLVASDRMAAPLERLRGRLTSWPAHAERAPS